ncbi:MAG: 3-hexulose-6-phosphate isomerase [Candidatus Bathyarchaeota archaeon BA2]|nr:MAG: 3-hexulose-6-phosphate isomerase [Candidatus Bathyarchaeota archaeon BA2]
MPLPGQNLKWLRAASKEILEGAQKAIDRLDMDLVEKLIQMILESKEKKIFVVGVGRSGFVGRAFALRLMNLGFNVYFLGETITPAAGKEDLLIAISGSGTTKFALTASSAAKEIGTKVAAITSYPKSPLGDVADLIVSIGGRTKVGWPKEEDYLARQLLGERETLSPLGSIFENNCMVFLDSLVVELMHRLGKTEEELRKLHATIE